MAITPIRTAAWLRKTISLRPSLAIVLGSGFNGIAQSFDDAEEVSYNRLPGFQICRVKGHPGRAVAGRFGGVPVLALCGRAHFYEGYTMSEITFPIRVLAEFGIQRVLLTNAAGGINPRFHPGNFMCLTDHINLMGANPLRGSSSDRRTCFVDLSTVYDPILQQLLMRAGQETKVRVRRGVYLSVSGPTYETPAEIRAFARLGADAVGMSTVPEAIVARHCDLQVAGLSCITNLAAGRNLKPLAHAEVLEMGRSVESNASRLLRRFIQLQEAQL